jgi:hypothetical protein
VKLQAFMDSLPADEERMMELILQQASTEDDVAGYGIIGPEYDPAGLAERGIIIINSRAGGALAPGVRQGIIIIGGKVR